MCYCNTSADDKLIKEHQFYSINYADWAFDHDGDVGEDEENIQSDPEPGPQSMDDAVKKYRDRAVEVLFNELGLVYWSIHDQVMRQDRRE